MADFVYLCCICGLQWYDGSYLHCPACSSSAIHARAMEGELPEAEQIERLKASRAS